MARVKVLHVINNLRGGGAEEQLRLLLQCLPPDRLESAVWCADARMDFGDLGDEVTVVEAPRRFRWDQRWGALAQFLEEWQPDVVHNWLPATIWTSAVPIRLRSNARFLGAYRNTYSLWSLRRLLQLGGYLFVDQIVSNTAVPGPGYGWMFRRRNGVVIHNAIDMERLSCAKPAGAAGLVLKNAVTFLFAARIVGHKNLKVVIDAIGALRDEGRRVKLVVCGDGPMRQELVELVAKRGLGDAVAFCGHVTNLPGVMKRVDALVMPSFREGMPNVVFEAMALRVPVIASDIPAHSQWLVHEVSALLFDPSRAEDLADKMRRILDEPIAEKDARRSRAFDVAHGLSGERMAADYCALYENLVWGMSTPRLGAS